LEDRSKKEEKFKNKETRLKKFGRQKFEDVKQHNPASVSTSGRVF